MNHTEQRPEAARIAFITGAAAGIGRACARRFASAGWSVALTDIDGAALAALRDELGPRCVFDAVLDVSDNAQVAEVFARYGAHHGRLDLLVNNAGVLEMGDCESLPLLRQQRINHVNNDGVLACSVHAFPWLAAAPGARMVNLSSASARYGVPGLAVYSASKFWVRGLTEALNLEWERHGIWVCDVMPNLVGTDMLAEHRQARMVQRVGVKLGPGDVAEVVWRAATGPRRLHWSVEKSALLRVLTTIQGALPLAVQRIAMKLIVVR